jgi:hypothetical protein
MGAAQLSEVDDRKYRDALAAAGYTGSRGAVLFCLMLAVVGAGLGSVVLAIILMATVPGIGEPKSTLVGALAGAVLLAAVGLVKIRRGNLEAREIVEDKEWRRQLLRRHGDSAP